MYFARLEEAEDAGDRERPDPYPIETPTEHDDERILHCQSSAWMSGTARR